MIETRAQGRFLPAHFNSSATISRNVFENRTVKKDLWSFFEQLRSPPTEGGDYLILAKIVYDFQHDLLLNTCSGLLDTRGLMIYTAEDNSVSI